MLAEFDMDSLLLFPTLRIVSRVIRLVINQSVCSCGVKSTPEDQSCFSVVCTLRLCLYTKYVIY
jgi:hypothetical protein